MSEEIHDFSRLDVLAASRRRAMFLHSVWRPALAGAAGAAIVIAAVAVAQPRFVYREIEIPRVTMKDVTVPNVIQKDVIVDHVIPHDVPIEIPRIIQRDAPPQASANPPAGAAGASESPYAAKTPEEKKFVDKPEYKDATYRGRIVKSKDGRSLTFADGKFFNPAHWDAATGKSIEDVDVADDTDQFIGDLGMCVQEKDRSNLWLCTALHDGVEVPIRQKPMVKSSTAGQSVESSNATPPATEMITTLVDINGFERRPLVDSGNSFGLSIPKKLADQLVRLNRANRGAPSQTTLADGSTQNVDTIEIRYIVVSGRTLYGVVASVSPSDDAPILLGLAALNRLGPYHFTDDGRIVFTGAPA